MDDETWLILTSWAYLNPLQFTRENLVFREAASKEHNLFDCVKKCNFLVACVYFSINLNFI